MQFLKTLFWVVLAVLVALFCYNNWSIVPVNLWSGLILETKLPVLLIVAFLAGLLPTLLLHRATRWRLRRKLESTERSVAELRAAALAAVDPSPPPPPTSTDPIVVPPAAL
jgi:uncharacterized integral membrane protein